jgi:hypothetical protein
MGALSFCALAPSSGPAFATIGVENPNEQSNFHCLSGFRRIAVDLDARLYRNRETCAALGFG